ncbi:MAG: UDP-N-acetylmuramoyl-L-alanine--D-glutamate ligase [Neptuniibacter caesariensis]|uniref:UDP-N-acetylmuramoylalanine--D-glutamate ligase n=1 Tax=Neptuniibacter caesariensis TaxID=207954 RepID=A0A2G6JPQ8_NEPCE|nr:MAG: UDP-N-acetylmuramoyl-L-alanine--D-glutamate ligase [Neptuniibacter caesariensis]
MGLIASDKFTIVVGLGKTGLACARFLAKKGVRFSVVDSRQNPPGADELKAEFPAVNLICGEFDGNYLSAANEIILSPGVAQSHPAIRQAVAAGVKLSGDIDLFSNEVSAPIVAITGSNAKSTVTTLVGEMAKAAGIDVGVCGNIGTPVLSMLEQPEKALYVMELSSFQLETTHDLRAEVATVLNISPDHMDRYDSMQDYYQAKHRIFRGAKNVVVNRDDSLTAPLLPQGVQQTAFHLGKPDLKLFGLIEEQDETWLAIGLERLVAASELKIRGRHNLANALAALALGQAARLPMAAMIKALKQFSGLKHRCEWVAELSGVTYFNDSKGTNVGATVAALNGLGSTLNPENGIVLIAGGDGKGSEFTELAEPLKNYGRALVYIGVDGQRLADQCGEIEKQAATTMDEAVQTAARLAREGDIVLLSPACASFDMFTGFPQRGDKFVQAVEAL